MLNHGNHQTLSTESYLEAQNPARADLGVRIVWWRDLKVAGLGMSAVGLCQYLFEAGPGAMYRHRPSFFHGKLLCLLLCVVQK
jgi:hypothetical protein